MTKKRKRSTLARRAARSMAQLPESDGLRPIGGPAGFATAVVGPGWMGMCPVIFTQAHSVVVFVPADLFNTFRNLLRAPGGPKLDLRLATGGDNQQIVTQVFKEW